MKTKNFLKLILAMIIFTVPITSATACKSSTLKMIKPDDSSNKSDALIPNESNQTRDSGSEPQAQELELLSIEFRFSSLQTINDACAGYQFSHGVLPEKIEDLIDGFMVFWPGCVYNDKPLMIMHSMPDPNNPEHIGKIFYERLNNIQAKIYYLDVDIEKSQTGQLAWKVKELNVELFIQDELNPDGSYKRVPGSLSPRPQDSFTPQEKFLIGFRDIFYLKIRQLLNNYLQHFGKIDGSFEDMLKAKKCFIFKKGLDTLDKYVRDGSIKFNMGAAGDGSHYYYDDYRYNIFSKEISHSSSCIGVDDSPQSGYTGAIFYKLKSNEICPEFRPNGKSILNSNDPSTYRFSDDLLITGDEVIYH